MTQVSIVLIGNQSLTRECGDALIARGHSISGVVTRDADVRKWALSKGLAVAAQNDWAATQSWTFDWLLSIANLNVIPAAILARATKGGVNFHDGPLPAYAGLNAPVWAILNMEKQHGITWHLMEDGIDQGDILEQRLFDIAPTDTALTLNTRCFEAALESFPAVVAQLEGGLNRQKQHLGDHRVYLRSDRPEAFGRIDFNRTVEQVLALVRGLDHGRYWNPTTTAKIATHDQVLNVAAAENAQEFTGTWATAPSVPGSVMQATQDGIVVACSDGAVRLTQLTCVQKGLPVLPELMADRRLASPTPAETQMLNHAQTTVVKADGAMRKALLALEPAVLSMANEARLAPSWCAIDLGREASLETLALACVRCLGVEAVDLAYVAQTNPAPAYLSDWVPIRLNIAGNIDDARQGFNTALVIATAAPHFARDLCVRDVALVGIKPPQIAITKGDVPLAHSVITLTSTTMYYDATRLQQADAIALGARLSQIAQVISTKAGSAAMADVPALGVQERAQVLQGWNQTAKPYDRSLCVHHAFEAQVGKTPDATALVCEGQSLTYSQLNAKANQAAHVLMDMGVGPGVLVGLCAVRSLEMLIGALAIQKAGGAYVPMDPAYPADRIALYIEDSACPVIVTQSHIATNLPNHSAQCLCLDTDVRLQAAPHSNPHSGVTSADLAYMIYTSGSTGRPKGVMVEHRNVINFFVGMDGRIGTDGGVWLAVTSLSFDISVLELFWTLARGFKVVISSDQNRSLVSGGKITSEQKIDFSLYYWGNDDGVGPAKYELLLEGAKFADTNGFCAVWTPERHFHAFGGPYPNPSVTGAAVAAVTKNIAVRAGSCVAPLHHPLRIAEEWAVIDNLTNGRVGLAMASGWHPDDFVLRPENTPPHNRKALFEITEQVRKLWRGEKVEFPTANGGTFSALSQPRPVSKELQIWITTAGNPETWREAGAHGANVLTHLLGQTIPEVEAKIKIYHQALRDAGHDPARFQVTLLLHTYLAKDRDTAREIARGPMKEYLRSAAALIKQYAWAFPAFKKPQGITNPMDIDIQSLSPEEMDAILDFAFLRYFEDSGLFGTVDDALTRVESLKAIGVGEVACLIDYGIETQTVLASLPLLTQVKDRANAGGGVADDDFSIAGQIIRHKVTHLQCTPSMARMIALNDDSRLALGGIKTLMVGGEALPGALVNDLRGATSARILNMYGPTETTIWSSVEEVAGMAEPISNIGRPLSNQQMYVLDDAQQPVAVGVAGELWIGGDGVTRGYWQRPDLTSERFRPDPFVTADQATPWGARMYQTGDLVRWRADGKIDFIGRADHQVKLRGYRIELGEIEAVLEAQPNVRQAVVLAREDVPGDLRLVAYFVGTAPVSVLAAALRVALPEHMVPAHFVVLDRFALTPNRKVDRKALPMPQEGGPEAARFVAPESDVEAKIAAVWQRVLGVARVGAKDNFFALGGHSLLAVQAHREIREALGATKLSITDIFRFPTLSALAKHLDHKPVVAGPSLAKPDVPGALSQRADARNDAMAKRLAMRAKRAGVDA